MDNIVTHLFLTRLKGVHGVRAGVKRGCVAAPAVPGKPLTNEVEFVLYMQGEASDVLWFQVLAVSLALAVSGWVAMNSVQVKKRGFNEEVIDANL